MSLLSALSRPLAALVAAQTRNWSRHPRRAQQRIFDELVRNGRMTAFGQDHAFDTIRTYAHFSKQVPVRDYEALRPWLDRVKAAEDHVLWPGKPLYLAKTSGTTSGAKYIPITRASIPNHIESTRNALLNYIHRTGKARFLDGKLIFISGSPALDTTNGILTGRLSGIVNHHVPAYLRRNQLPSYATNTIEDWEVKVDAIVEETLRADMRFISGIPPWVQMYFDRLTTRTGKPIKDIFPNFELFVYGGVNYEPYRAKIEQSIGRPVDSIELYPASEGFIAYQDIPGDPGMLLMLNSGIFYEFIPLAEYFSPNPTRLPIWEVQPGVNYAIVLNTNAGLWGYSLGDTVRFVSTDPYRLVVTGRVKHFISAFGEHVIAEEVEKALAAASRLVHAEVIEFTVAPQVSPPEGGLPYHEWFIEFGKQPENLEKFRLAIDESLQRQNIYYRDLIAGHILQPLRIRPLAKDTFITYMRNAGKLGGQNKVPRLSNDRALVDGLAQL
ncbi:MAG: GH3 auxin-responsive promoter family protein [Bacteroidia bacterium]|nr:GH3 auxin-responsive promoter family protein [Bacteroidia bacterium]MBP7728515.1 GH3 auxin-responsive promoter family protein [Bacteroidia bacterium]MBP7772438.1 GH3 auxin-responsive promoter family protein [Bacteroidia bacterium]